MVDWILKSGTMVRTESQLVFDWNIHYTDVLTHCDCFSVFVFPSHLLLGILLWNGGFGIFNVHNSLSVSSAENPPLLLCILTCHFLSSSTSP